LSKFTPKTFYKIKKSGIKIAGVKVHLLIQNYQNSLCDIMG
jgi:hypothetical protein